MESNVSNFRTVSEKKARQMKSVMKDRKKPVQLCVAFHGGERKGKVIKRAFQNGFL